MDSELFTLAEEPSQTSRSATPPPSHTPRCATPTSPYTQAAQRIPTPTYDTPPPSLDFANLEGCAQITTKLLASGVRSAEEVVELLNRPLRELVGTITLTAEEIIALTNCLLPPLPEPKRQKITKFSGDDVAFLGSVVAKLIHYDATEKDSTPYFVPMSVAKVVLVLDMSDDDAEMLQNVVNDHIATKSMQ